MATAVEYVVAHAPSTDQAICGALLELAASTSVPSPWLVHGGSRDSFRHLSRNSCCRPLCRKS